MRNRPFRLVHVLMLAVVASTTTACSGGDKIVGANGSPSTPSGSNNGSSKLSAADSLFLVNYMSAGSWALMKQMRTITNIQVTGFGSTRPSCTPVSISGGADANSNGLPDDQTTTYAASSCSFLSSGANTTASGSFRLQDLGGFYGYRVTYTNYVLVGTKGDSVVTATLNGSVEYRYPTSSSGVASDNTVLVVRSQSSQGSITLTRTAALTGTLTPNSGPFSLTSFPGTSFSVSGTLALQLVLTGNAIQSGYPASSSFNIAMSTSNAINSPSNCASNPGFTSGAVDGALTGTWQSTLRLTYGACGTGASENPGTKR